MSKMHKHHAGQHANQLATGQLYNIPLYHVWLQY